MGRHRAAYMRKYRAAKKAARPPWARLGLDADLTRLGLTPEHGDRIAELEEEVARLKRELAARPGQSFNSRPFTPVPKQRG